MESKKFDPKKLAKLNDPRRLEFLDPDLMWRTLDLESPDVLIDIGAGTGFFASIFSGKLKDGKVYACDILDVMIEWMKENLPAKSKGKVVPVRMEESSVPLPDSMADLVYMINLHHELDEPMKVLGEAFRLLKGKGRLMVVDWKKEETPEGPPIEIRLTEDAVEDQMRTCGFKGIKRHPGLPYHYFLTGEKP